jgi:O-antigen ligase
MEHTSNFGLAASTANDIQIAENVRETHSSLEDALVLSVLVFSTSAFLSFLPGEVGNEFEEKGQIFAQVVWSVLYLLLFLLMRRRLKSLLNLLWQEKWILMLTSWALLSLIWSIDRPLTFRRLIALLCTEAFGVYFAFRYTLQEQLDKISRALAIVIGASILVCILYPPYGLSGAPADEGAWQGVFSHKNTLGGFAMLLAFILFIRYLEGKRRVSSLVGIAILSAVVIFSQSRTSLAYLLLASIAFPLVRSFQKNPSRRTRVVLAGALIFGVLATLTIFHWEDLVFSIGRDPTLTGRTELWALSLIWIREKPILGSGLEAFWGSYYGPAADFRIASGWLEAPHAHNAYLNLWLDLGLVGVVLAIGSLATNLGKAIKLLKETDGTVGMWPIVFFGITLAFSLTGGAFLARNDLNWILYISTAMGMRPFLGQDTPMQMQSSGAQRSA